MITLEQTVSKVQETAFRFKLAALAFKQASNLKPIIKLKNGAYIDLSSKTIVLPQDTHIHCDGNLKLTSDKNIIMRAGLTPDPDRPGYMYGIWNNTEEDSLGRPLKKEVKPCTIPNCNCGDSK